MSKEPQNLNNNLIKLYSGIPKQNTATIKAEAIVHKRDRK
jgi:hypothetical protein